MNSEIICPLNNRQSAFQGSPVLVALYPQGPWFCSCLSIHYIIIDIERWTATAVTLQAWDSSCTIAWRLQAEAGTGAMRLRREVRSSCSSGMDSSKSVQASASLTKTDASCWLMLAQTSLMLSEAAVSEAASSVAAACASRVACNT